MPRNDVSYSRLNLLTSLHFNCVFKTKQIILPGFCLLMFSAFLWAEYFRVLSIKFPIYFAVPLHTKTSIY